MSPTARPDAEGLGMMTDADLEMLEPPPVPTAANPFALGWRHGRGGLPLTEHDLLWQEEGDQIVTNDAHTADMFHLYDIIGRRIAGRPGLRVFTDHCIDFQVEGLGVLGPDVVLFNGEPTEWDSARGTFPVRDMGARPLYAFEVTSPGTRRRDFRERLWQYYRAGIPGYVVIDAPYGGGRRAHGIVAFQAGPTGYEQLPARPDGRVWIEVAEIDLALVNGRLICLDPDGNEIPHREELARQYLAEKVRADAEKVRADAEKVRADALAAKMYDLEAELRRLRGENP